MDDPVRILLVEDNAADVYLFRKALQTAELDFQLTVIENGADAVTFVRGEGKYTGRPLPDLAVLDLNLPRDDGIQVLEEIRREKQFDAVPVVITSSSPLPPARLKRKQLQVARYVVKPADLEEFLKIGETLKEVLLERQDGRADGGAGD